jgi:CRP-like cAMP-binding protein
MKTNSNKSKNIPISCQDCNCSHNFFGCLSTDEKTILSEKKGSNYYKKGQVIFYEGNHAMGLFCLFDGKVKLSKLGNDGKDQIVRFSKSGDIMGYRSLLSNEPYHATATAMEDSYICMVSKENFLAVVEENPKLSLKLIQLLSKDLKTAEQHLIDVAQKTVKERISESLLVLKSTFGLAADNKTLNISLTRSEIADMAGTTTESAIRTLAQLCEEGVILLEGRSIVILDVNALVKCANVYD